MKLEKKEQKVYVVRRDRMARRYADIYIKIPSDSKSTSRKAQGVD